MHFLDRTLDTLADNLALDEALLVAAEEGIGGEVLRVWEWPSRAVVLGAGGIVADDVELAACEADGVPLARRSSGGGTVLLGSGCLLYSVVLAYDRDPALADVRASYRVILDVVGRILADVLPVVSVEGSSDLAAGGLKFSGNAQQRKRDHLLHHGTLLYDFDLASVGRYLKPPPRQPEYREGRDHLAFLRNVPLTAADLIARLRTAWNAVAPLASWPEETVRRLVAEKYGSVEWVRRR